MTYVIPQRVCTRNPRRENFEDRWPHKLTVVPKSPHTYEKPLIEGVEKLPLLEINNLGRRPIGYEKCLGGNSLIERTLKRIRLYQFIFILFEMEFLSETLNKKEGHKPHYSLVTIGVVASIFLYISSWELLDTLLPREKSSLRIKIYALLMICSLLVLAWIAKQNPKSSN